MTYCPTQAVCEFNYIFCPKTTFASTYTNLLTNQFLPLFSIPTSCISDDNQMNHLNDSHAQLMVHWLGEGTNVMLCLAREPPPSYLDDPKLANVPPSSVYISYDNGDEFQDKTLMFTVEQFNQTIGKTETKNSTLDQFITHPNYNTVRMHGYVGCVSVSPTPARLHSSRHKHSSEVIYIRAFAPFLSFS